MTTLVTPTEEQSEVKQARRDECPCVGSAVAVALRPDAETLPHVRATTLHLLQADDHGKRPQHSDNNKRTGSVGEMTHRNVTPTFSLIGHRGDESFPQDGF